MRTYMRLCISSKYHNVRYKYYRINCDKTSKVRARLELAAFCVLGRCDNHYTTEPVLMPINFLVDIIRLIFVYSVTVRCSRLRGLVDCQSRGRYSGNHGILTKNTRLSDIDSNIHKDRNIWSDIRWEINQVFKIKYVYMYLNCNCVCINFQVCRIQTAVSRIYM